MDEEVSKNLMRWHGAAAPKEVGRFFILDLLDKMLTLFP
jgi:hypothetical protein